MIKILRKKIKSSFYYELVTNYFSKFKKSYAESFGEDLFVNYFFQKKKKGLYVDVGCNLPKSRSIESTFNFGKGRGIAGSPKR